MTECVPNMIEFYSNINDIVLSMSRYLANLNGYVISITELVIKQLCNSGSILNTFFLYSSLLCWHTLEDVEYFV